MKILIEAAHSQGREFLLFTRTDTVVHEKVWEWALKYQVVLRQVKIPL